MTQSSVLEAPRKRRRFSAPFKARIIEACQQPGASVAGIALQHRLNANLVHTWIRKAGQRQAVSERPAFVPLPLTQASVPMTNHDSAAGCIRLTLPHANGSLVVEWPASEAEACQSLIRDLLT